MNAALRCARRLSLRPCGVSCALVKEKWNLWLPVILMLVFALTRWPGLLPPNFSAFYALAFCAGVYFPRRLAWWLPLATMVATDLALNLYYPITNTASWLFNPFQNPEYTKNFAGWLTALTSGTKGWPQTWEFFRNTL